MQHSTRLPFRLPPTQSMKRRPRSTNIDKISTPQTSPLNANPEPLPPRPKYRGPQSSSSPAMNDVTDGESCYGESSKRSKWLSGFLALSSGGQHCIKQYQKGATISTNDQEKRRTKGEQKAEKPSRTSCVDAFSMLCTPFAEKIRSHKQLKQAVGRN
jgi:hypothetical protein